MPSLAAATMACDLEVTLSAWNTACICCIAVLSAILRIRAMSRFEEPCAINLRPPQRMAYIL